MLTKERTEALIAIFNADEDRAIKLAKLDTEMALKEINALGNDFTIDEYNEFEDALKIVAEKGEFSAEDLDKVVGGSMILGLSLTTTLIIAAGGAVVGAVAGYVANKK